MQKESHRRYHPEISEKSYSPHPIIYFKHYLFGSAMVASLAFFHRFRWVYAVAAAGLIYLLFTELFRRAHKYLITNKGVINQFSFLSKRRSSALYDRIQYMHFNQSVIERIFGIGELHISTSGTKNIEIVFNGIKNPGKVKKIIEHNMDNINHSRHSKHYQGHLYSQVKQHSTRIRHKH